MKQKLTAALTTAILLVAAISCSPGSRERKGQDPERVAVIFDTDANNELDDQHALAYLLLNDSTFETVGITVNATRNGGEIDNHVEEALRVVALCGKTGKVPVLKGANGSFREIEGSVGEPGFDGKEAVDFIIREARKDRKQPLVLLPVGKLTNIALALKIAPDIAGRVRVVWLGSNYPDPGEYNLDNDTASMNYVLESEVPFEMVTVRYGKPSGTAAVKVSRQEIFERMPGLGPESGETVTGRHGGTFNRFGDYSVSLFEHTEYFEDGKYRSLFDLAAVAIVKDPSWARTREIPAPVYQDGAWVNRPGNRRTILLWEQFDKEAILADFYATLR